MNYKLNQVLNYILIFFFTNLVCAQIKTGITDVLVDDFQKLAVRQASDIVYLQSSKGIYETGEDLWFKGYVLNSMYLMPSTQSKTLYVQLIEDQTTKAVWEEKYEIENGFVDGHIYIKDSLRPGSYTLAAYTPYSLYENHASIKSIRKLKIVNTITEHIQIQKEDSVIPSTKQRKGLDFQLFPEGGYLLSGTENKVAFKATDTVGNPLTVSGTLFENNKPIKTFKSVHAGMGYFMVRPSDNSRYHIELDSSTIEKTFSLPSVKTKGLALQLIRNTKEYLLLKVAKNDSEEKEIVYLRVQIRGVVYSLAKAVIAAKEQFIKIPIGGTPHGIAEVTLFDQNIEPVAERLVYINQDHRLNIKATLNKGEYSTKSNATLRFKVTDHNNKPVRAHLGLSVFDSYYNNLDDPKTIESHYHLSTQLKGKLYNPSYYFNTENHNRKQALDLLLLTQGWRAYKWTETNLTYGASNKKTLINDTITGKLQTKNKKDEVELPQQYVMGFKPGGPSNNVLLEVDSKGSFSVLPNYLQEVNEGYLYVKLLYDDAKNKTSIIINDSSFETINRLRDYKPFSYPMLKFKANKKQNLKAFTSAQDFNKLEEVVVVGDNKPAFRDKFMGQLDSLAKLDINNDFVCGVGGTNGHRFLNCKMHPYRTDHTKPVEGETYYKHLGFEWIIPEQTFKVDGYKEVVYRYPKLTEEDLLKKFNLARIKGYYGKRKFYTPVYDKTEPKDGFPDYRNTLFWKPEIITDERGEAQVQFSTSDINSKFIVKIEGVGDNGILGYETFDFRVNKVLE